MKNLGQVRQVDLLADGRLAQAGLEDGHTRGLVGQRDVNELIQSTGTEDGRIDNVGSVQREKNVKREAMAVDE